MSGNLKSLAALIEDAVILLSSWENGKSGTTKITIANEEGTAITIVVGQKTLASFLEHPSGIKSLSDLENAILNLLRQSRSALRGKEIAAAISRPYTSHFREVLADLCNRKIILKSTEGYYLPPGLKPPD
jgi:hypothetical protein